MILCYRSRSTELKSDHSVFNALSITLEKYCNSSNCIFNTHITLKNVVCTKKTFHLLILASADTYKHVSFFVDTRVYTCQNVAVTGKGD